MSNGNIRHVEATFDMWKQHVEFDMLLVWTGLKAYFPTKWYPVP